MKVQIFETFYIYGKYFLPSFFNIMVHLIGHLIRTVCLCGYVFMRWMYPIDRVMKVLKGYAQNCNHPK